MALAMIFSSIPDVIVTKDAVEIFKHLQYPEFLIRFLGIAKLLAVIAILVPGMPRLKEWAYAGLVFDLTGAVFAGWSVGDPIVQWLPIAVFYILIAGSYYSYHRYLKNKEQQDLQIG